MAAGAFLTKKSEKDIMRQVIQLPLKCCDLFVGGLYRNVQSFIICRVRTNVEFVQIPTKIVGYKTVKNRCRYYGR